VLQIEIIVANKVQFGGGLPSQVHSEWSATSWMWKPRETFAAFCVRPYPPHCVG